MEHFFLTQPNLSPVDSFAGAAVVGPVCRLLDGSRVPKAVRASFGPVSGLVLRVHTAAGASVRAMFTSPAGGVGGLAATCAEALTAARFLRHDRSSASRLTLENETLFTPIHRIRI